MPVPRAILRLAGAGLVILVFLFLFNTLEVRKTAYSCRTFWDCIGVSSRYNPVQASQDAAWARHTEFTLRDGTRRYDRHYADNHADLAILVLSRDKTSWSSDFRSTLRTIHDLLELIRTSKLDLGTVSLSLLTDSVDEYQAVVAAIDKLPLARMTVFLRNATEQDYSYEQRHRPDVQLARRSNIAAVRNYLMHLALQDERHILWLDADVVELSDGIIRTMLEHSNSNPEAGIITAECHQNQMDNYDKNAWRMNSPELKDVVPSSERNAAVEKLGATRVMVPEIINGTADAALLPLDSVGGTILYIRAGLVRQGLAFPHYNVVGTTWEEQGWIGVETEGLCYAARGLPGGKCFVLGGHHHVRHSDWG